ncbi:MAG: pentapeptide repeat-containing protein, partial [Cyanobacteria bacterium P01_A01_bin.83]
MITLEELFNRYQAGERNFSRINSRLGKLFNKNLTGINLSNANLDRISLLDCNLSGANLSNANVAGSNLDGINLSEANLNQTNFCVAENIDYSHLIEIMESNLSKSLEYLPPEIAAQTMEQMSQMS